LVPFEICADGYESWFSVFHIRAAMRCGSDNSLVLLLTIMHGASELYLANIRTKVLFFAFPFVPARFLYMCLQEKSYDMAAEVRHRRWSCSYPYSQLQETHDSKKKKLQETRLAADGILMESVAVS